MAARRKDRVWIGLGVAASVVVIALAWFFLVNPQLGSKSSAEGQTTDAQMQNLALQQKINKLRQDSQNSAALQAQLDHARDALPTAHQLDEFTRQVTAQAQTAGVTVVSITPTSPVVVQSQATPVPTTANTGEAAPTTTVPAAPKTAGPAGQSLLDPGHPDQRRTPCQAAGAAQVDPDPGSARRSRSVLEVGAGSGDARRDRHQGRNRQEWVDHRGRAGCVATVARRHLDDDHRPAGVRGAPVPAGPGGAADRRRAVEVAAMSVLRCAPRRSAARRSGAHAYADQADHAAGRALPSAASPRSGRLQRRRLRGQEGFTLIEMMVALTLVTVVMAALTVLFVNTMSSVSHLRAKQVATSVASSAVDKARGLGALGAESGRDSSSVTTQFATFVHDAGAVVADAHDAGQRSRGDGWSGKGRV